jgi:hypothetical protein
MRIGTVIAVLPNEVQHSDRRHYCQVGDIEFQMMTIIWRAMGLDNEEGAFSPSEWVRRYCAGFAQSAKEMDNR